MSYDLNIAINNITEMFNILTNSYGICCDVGNNEFWVSRAYAESNNFNRIIYSKSFGVLGCGIAKAIGVYYASKMPVICYIGDQGFQLNIQELQFIVQEQLPIYVVVLNNKSSGMIKSREKIKYGEHYVHTTRASGYGVPDIEKVAASYGIQYYKYDKNIDTLRRLLGMNHPLIIEMELDEKIDLEPSLPAGNECQRMSPEIEKNLYDELSKL